MPVLYSDLLLDHFRHPRNYGSLEAPDVSYEAFNPLCGDRIRIEVRLDNEIVTEARFKGDGCAISMAAASLLTELVVGAKVNQLISDDELVSVLQSDIQPARIQCAILPLTALRDGLKHR
jgi:nitrogen fixation NifU-like protein